MKKCKFYLLFVLAVFLSFTDTVIGQQVSIVSQPDSVTKFKVPYPKNQLIFDYQSNRIWKSNAKVDTSKSISTISKSAVTDKSQITVYPEFYVNSDNGVNAPTRGMRETPFKTIQYAISVLDLGDTITGNGNQGEYTITGISDIDYAKCFVGKHMSGSNLIGYGANIVSLDGGGVNNKTVTLSIPNTASGLSVPITVWNPCVLKVYGNHNVTANIFKEGISYDFGNSSVVWGNFSLFDVTMVLKIDLNIVGGNFSGVGVNSIFYKNTQSQNVKFREILTDLKITTNTTNYGLRGVSNLKFRGYLDCQLGGCIHSDGFTYSITIDKSSYMYGFLDGIYILSSGNLFFDGEIKTPTTINSIRCTNILEANGIIHGKITISNQSAISNYSIINARVFGVITTTTVWGTALTINGHVSNIVNNGGNMTINGRFEYLTNGGGFTTINSSAEGDYKNYIQTITSGKIINNGNNYYYMFSMSGGEFVNNGKLIGGGGWGLMTISGGKFINNGIIDENNQFRTYFIDLTSGTIINKGLIKGTSTSLSYTLIVKNSGIFVNDGGQLIVSNGKSPIKCTANTSVSRDIYVLGCTTNCDGSTYGLLLPFDGSSFAPNPIILNNLNESTTYNW